MTSKSDNPEWVEEKMDGEIPLDYNTCVSCNLKSPNLIPAIQGKKHVYMCSKSYNSSVFDLYYPDPVPHQYLVSTQNYPCLNDLEDPF